MEGTQHAKSDWEVSIVGEGPLLRTLQNQVRLVAHQPIDFIGPRHNSDDALRSCDVMCLPSRFESAPYVLLEAMVRERAIVASAVDGIPEVIENGVSGILVPPDNSHALAEARDHMIDANTRRTFAAAARRRAVELYDLATMINATLSLYESLT
jgi:glycosyltransferase involved in cell wall biosynthesis